MSDLATLEQSIIGQIAAASDEQSTGVNQINTAVTQLSQTTQQNAAASEQLAATAHSMGTQSQTLQQTMGFFKTGSRDVILAGSSSRPSLRPSNFNLRTKPDSSSPTRGAARRDDAETTELDESQSTRFV